MTVAFSLHASYELCFAEYSGTVSVDELVALSDFLAAQPTLLSYDTLSWIAPGADFSAFDPTALDAMFARYRTLFQPLNLVILRRGAWVCDSPACEPYLERWLGEPDLRKTLSSDVRRFPNIQAAAEWLLLDPGKAAVIARREGFRELARFG